jgi:hypothetical protein
MYGFRYTVQLCHTGINPKGFEKETGFQSRGSVGIWPCTIRRLCHTGARGLMKRLVFLGHKSGAIGRVLYGGSECLKGNNMSRTKSRETSERSEEVELS